ncbi:SseB family protein [Kitasatospora sp. NBC_01287]|uniref:SseB family protein n=1 Tax=Kitasatospora sp. NBC_01287 TaxID=2903573 RepID=UPI002254BD43|nr:SseB family protein [Kitasatospora sp. NBC_01287]MCX4750552.1 SseB family protein [Kitasatospora sp. NBC_01287]
MSGTGLVARLAALHAGQVDGPALVGELREALVLLPIRGGEPLAGDAEGVRWLYAFTGEAALARFASARGVEGEVEYLTVRGSRLLDVAVPALGARAGVALDVAGPAPFLLPASAMPNG